MRGLTLVVFLAAFAFYCFHSAPSVTAGDAGEFMTAAATLSLAHAPSYPTYSILGRGYLTLVPFGSTPYRMNVFSALTASLGICFLFLALAHYSGSPWGAFLVAFIIGLSGPFLTNSLVTEVFALNAMFFSGILYLLVPRKQSEGFPASSAQMKRIVLATFLLGFGLGNHQVLVFLLPFVFILAVKHAGTYRRQNLGLAALAGLLGFSVNLFLPIRSAQEPPLNWGAPTTIQRFYRTLARKDYGSLTLALGEAPKRTLSNSLAQIRSFFRQFNHHVPWFLTLAALIGWISALRKSKPLVLWFAGLFVVFGPLFYWLGNLPFDAQSAGVMERFFIIPVIIVLLGLIEAVRLRPRIGAPLLVIFLMISGRASYAEAAAIRSGRLVHDYGEAMLRTLPPGAVLFMDGGDDAFYSLAMLHYVMGKRPDVALHDRGGLIFKNIYGDDFRRLTKEQKTDRRHEVERRYLGTKPVFYSTMDLGAMPGRVLRQNGFLYTAEARLPLMSWDLIAIRSLAPLAPADYRHRSLAAFFPYMRGQELKNDDRFDRALLHFKKAQRVGQDVRWLRSNLSGTYAFWGFDRIQDLDFDAAEKIYKQWIEFDPGERQAYTNLGVVYERQGQWEAAEQHYKDALSRFPEADDLAYNMAVIKWNQGNWPAAAEFFREALRRNPKHPTAGRFLEQAEQRAGSKT